MRRTDMKRTEMTRTTWMRSTKAGAGNLFHENREQRLALRAERAMAEVVARSAVLGPVTGMTAAPKDPEPLHSRAYRMAVAALPCAHCGIAGWSQHAHENEGKGKGVKLDDRRAMPLCCTRPGIDGCHVAFDQYRLLPGGREAHVAAGKRWAGETRRTLQDTGAWPKRLPTWPMGTTT